MAVRTITAKDRSFDTVAGELASSGMDTIARRREDRQVSTIVAHFPLAGFAMASAA